MNAMMDARSDEADHRAPSVIVIEHSPMGTLDNFRRWMHGLRLETVRPYAGDSLPDRVADGLIVLGGPMSASDDAVAPWLPGVRNLLVQVVAEEVPTIGICLGAQLLALACGGDIAVWSDQGWESGVVDVHWHAAAKSDPLVGCLPHTTAAPTMHRDAVDTLPQGATLLASTAQYPHQAFRVGAAAWGFQFHPEASVSKASHWARYRPDIDEHALRAELAARAPEIEQTGHALASRFCDLVLHRAAEPESDGRASEVITSRQESASAS